VTRPVEEAGRVPVVQLVLRAREHLPQRVGCESRRCGAPLLRRLVEHRRRRPRRRHALDVGVGVVGVVGVASSVDTGVVGAVVVGGGQPYGGQP
jgi:hypothetical protein